jgi:signal transduction histidine kinase
MKNKVKLKRFLFLNLVVLFCFLFVFLIINIYEYKIYNHNFNQKLSTIISCLEEKYPNLTENEIMDILNSSSSNSNVLEKYSIDLNDGSIILENDRIHFQFFILNIILIMIGSCLFVVLFLRFNHKKDKEINSITKYIEEINKKNYKLHIDDISEDELSILKNEIYKVTVMLKEDAENAKYEKLELKKSLSDISHQLKTPLTSILIILDNLIDNPDMDEVTREDFIRDIKREIMNITFLVQSILKLSKLDTNTVDFVYEDIYLKEIVNASIKNLSSVCDLKNIKIKTKLDENAKIQCDFKWQVEAITNIIKNSIEHSCEYDEILVEVSDNKVYSTVMIQDHGSGIAKEDLPYIFERFYKGKGAVCDSVGIGLSLAKSIIEKSNGTVSVESSDKGTIFTIKYFH